MVQQGSATSSPSTVWPTGTPTAEVADASPAIRTLGLRKVYASPRGSVEAVRSLDLDIGAGELFGLLGPNGAGKSTTIGMLTTLVVPSAGRAWVAGIDVAADPVGVKRRIGVVAQQNTLDSAVNAAENLEFRARFFGVPAREARRRAQDLLGMFGLTERAGAMVFELSGGQARRLMIARALVHRPDVLFLDEPTTGLDPQTRVNLWDTLRALHGAGQTILLTTHYMEEAQELCERVAIMDHGAVLASDTVAGLIRGAGADSVITVSYDGPVPESLRSLGDRPEINRVELDGSQLRVFSADSAGLLAELVAAGTRAGVAIRDANRLDPSLETVFLKLTGREYRE